MRSARIVPLVIGCLLFLPGTGLLSAGGGLGVAAGMQGEDGQIDLSLGQLTSHGVAKPDTPVRRAGA